MTPVPELLNLLDLPWAEFDAQKRLVRQHPDFPAVEEMPQLASWLQPGTAALVPPGGVVLAGPRGHDIALWPREQGGFWAVLYPRPQVRALAETWVEEKPLLNMLVHELRLPVTVIKGYTSLMEKGLAGPVTDKQKDFLTTMAANVQRLERLLELIGLLSKIAHRRLPYAPRTLTLDALLKEPVRAWDDRWAEKRLTFAPLPPEQAGWQVYTDPQYARWIVQQLLENAWAYTPTGGRVWLAAQRTGQGVALEVHDTGIGIAPEERARLFAPFFRSPDERVRDRPGWGLALHVARALARDLGGDLTYRAADPGPGSVFALHLPAAPEARHAPS